jgi:hypothetical protein
MLLNEDFIDALEDKDLTSELPSQETSISDGYVINIGLNYLHFENDMTGKLLTMFTGAQQPYNIYKAY